MDSRTKADQLAEEMSRFEQEILGASESAPKGPSSSTLLPTSTPNTSTPSQPPSQFFPRPPGPPGLPHPPGPPTFPRPPGPPSLPRPPGPPNLPRPPGLPHPPGPPNLPRPPGPPNLPRPPGPPGGPVPPPASAPPPLIPPRAGRPPQFQMPPGPPSVPHPSVSNGPPRLAPPPPAVPQQFPVGPRPHHTAPPVSQPPHVQQPPEPIPPLGAQSVPHLSASVAPLATYQPPIAKPTLPTPVFPRPSASSSSGASKTADTEGAEGGAMEVGLLPLPTKPPRRRMDVKKLRLGGGQVWEDHSLDDWDQNDFRIFVGDLGNDVNDDLLARTFSKYPTFLKARVIRDKWTKKAKGYGFVSFKDPHDFMQAMREMNGKYIGNRPMKLRKSTWKDRAFLEVKKKEKAKKRLGFKV